MPVFIPAGYDPEHIGEVAQLAGVKNKALMLINGKKLIEYVLEAVDNAKMVKSITI